jgi:hypothetical protein
MKDPLKEGVDIAAEAAARVRNGDKLGSVRNDDKL